MKIQLKKYNLFSIGQQSFLLGTFFLASALPISGIFFLISICISFKENKSKIFKDNWNYPLFLATGLIIFGALNNTNFYHQNVIHEIEKSNIIFGIFNWIPLFFSFIAFQAYLKNKSKRVLFGKYLIAGSIPVLISCILQYWFKVYGPFDTLNGLIIWFQKPIHGNSGVSGLFSNQNYAGFWLSTIWPFSIFFFKNINKSKTAKIFCLIISLIIPYLAILTNSRNSLVSLIISITILFKLKFFIILLILISLPLIIYFSLINLSIIEGFLPNKFLPIALIEKIFSLEFKSFVNFPRFEIWNKSIDLIFQKPFLGWGASTFAIIYVLEGGIYSPQHTHNMILELAYNFGIPLALIISTFSICILIKGWQIFLKNKKDFLTINSYWLASLTTVFLSHFNDISYYDGKISIFIWILLAGVKCMNEEQNV